MSPFIRLIRSRRGASSIELGLLVGLVATIALVAVLVFGGKVRDIFAAGNNAIELGQNGSGDNPTEPVEPAPTLEITATPSSIDQSQFVTVTWRAQHAATVTFTYALTGACLERTQIGDGPHPLAWASFTGSQNIAWSTENAGCQITWCGAAAASAKTASACASASFLEFDETPNPVSFSAVEVAPGAEATSESATISGINTTIPASVSNGTFSIDGGPWSGSGHVYNGAPVRLRATAPAIQGQTKTVVLNLGSTTAPWLVKATAEDQDPLALSFQPLADREPGASVSSNVEILGGFSGTQTFSVTEGSASIASGPFLASGSASAGDPVQLATTAPTEFGASKTVTFSIDGVTGGWLVSTRAKRSIPAPLPTFSASIGNDPSALVVSNAQTLFGIDAPVTLTANGGELSVDGGSFSSGPVPAGNGSSIVLRATAPASSAASTSVNIASDGSQIANWTVATRDFVPDLIAFGTMTASPSAVVESGTFSITGFTGTNTLAVSGGQVSVNSASFASSATVHPGDTVKLRTTSSSVNDGTGSVTVNTSTEGGQLGNWTVNTIDQVPSVIAFANHTGVEPDTTITSASATLSGFSGSLTATCGGACTQILKNGTPATQGATTFSAGDAIALRLVSGSYGETRNATLSIGGTGATWSVSTRALDNAPNAFAFAPQTGISPGKQVQSNFVTLTGFETPVTATCGSGCVTVYRNGAPTQQGITLFNPGDTIAIATVASSAKNTETTTTVTVGATTSNPWSVTTGNVDNAPNPFTFDTTTGVEANTTITSSPLIINGFDGPLTASCGQGCTGIVKNGTEAGTSVSVMPGDSLAIKMVSSTSWNAFRGARLDIGETSGTWLTQTRVGDSSPNAFSFIDQSNLSASATATSNAVTVSGFDGPLVVNCTGCFALRRNGSNAITGSTGFYPGDQLQVLASASSSYNDSKTIGITMGTHSTAWTITTKVQDTVPNAITFTNRTNVAKNAIITSNAVTISGFDPPLTATCSGDCIEILINGTHAEPGVTHFYPGDLLSIRLQSSASGNTTKSATVTVGTRISDVWTVSTAP